MRYFISLVLASTLAGGFAGCSSDDKPVTAMGPSSTTPGPPSISNAQVLVGGRNIQGLVVEGTDEPTLFRVRVQAPGGLATIDRVVLQYSQPGFNHHSGPMMGGFRGTAHFYDDGTHGDDIAGDGVYHFMDPDDDVGCHGTEAPRGEYHYEFWCEDAFGQRSNIDSATIIRE